MSQNTVDDLIVSYWGWMYAVQDTPVYKKMRYKQLVEIRNEIKRKTEGNWKQLIKEGDPNRNKK